MQEKKPKSDLWYLDTGAEEHVSNSKQELENISPTKKTMCCANSSTLEISGVTQCILKVGNFTMFLKKCL